MNKSITQIREALYDNNLTVEVLLNLSFTKVNMVINLMYHDVYEHDTYESGFVRERDFPYKIKADVFESQVEAISDYCQLANLPKDSVRFTFDDGGKSFHSVIAPILEKYGYKGLFFISTKYIGTETFLNKDEIRELHARGHIIGSHAHTHIHFYALSDVEVEDEWKQSVEILTNIIDEPIRYASIPNGDKSKRVLEYARKYGIEKIYTSEPTTKVSDFKGMEVIGRYVLLAENPNEDALSIVRSPKTRFILSCKRCILNAVKSIMGSNYVKLKNTLYRTRCK